jgi:8-oxo-dGTP pyrophosphatase MutT (NUDIX family)
MADQSYEGVTHAGLAVVAADTGRVFLAQRAMDPTDDESVAETWEFPGGSLNPGEDPESGAFREFSEEIGCDLPKGEVVNGWRGGDDPETGHYQGFVYKIPAEFPIEGCGSDEVQAVGWFDAVEVQDLENSGTMRPEIVATMDWSLIWGVSGNEDTMTDAPVDTEPEYDAASFAVGPIPVHGVIAPEDVATGDGRGFNSGSMTRRPMRLPFSDQHVSIGGHDGSVVTGSVDRMMRKDGKIHWEGALMPSQETERLVERMQFFGGRYGVSVDGDNGSLDTEKSKATGVTWFDAVRAAGLTAVAIPAFHEAYVAFGNHPEMPAEDDALTASMFEDGNIVGARVTFDRGPGWVTNPVETRRIHDYWTKPGQPGYAKIGWGTAGDWTRAKALIGEKIAANSPDKMRFLNQIISQWHFDALGYWPGDWDMPGNDTTAEGRAKRAASLSIEEALDANPDLEPAEDEESVWETVLVSSAAGTRVLPTSDYFTRHPDTDATTIEDLDSLGLRRVHGYAAEWGVCHIGYTGRCIEPPQTGSDEYPEFHLGVTRTSDEGRIKTGLLTYKVSHRDADTILSETPEQCHFDNIANAWAAVRLGEDERGIWYSGYVLPHVSEEDIALLEASGQVSGEWKYGALRACLAVNVPGYPVMRASAAYDDEGNVVALAACAYQGALVASVNGVEDSECHEAALSHAEPTPAERMRALASIDAEVRMDALRKQFNWVDVAEDLMAEAEDEGRVAPVGLREDGAVVYEKDGVIPGTDEITEDYPTEAGA